jgi:hypothetical protein
MAGYLAAREATVMSLVAELAEASGAVPLHAMEWSGGLRAVGGGMPVKGSEGSACDRAWQDGVDLARLAAAGKGLSVLGYVAEPSVLRSDLAGYRARLPAGTRLSVALRPMPPDCDSAEALAAKLRVLAEFDVAAADFYHYGFMRLANLAWIGQAAALASGAGAA